MDRCGALCSNREITAVLWEEDGRDHASYLKSIRADLLYLEYRGEYMTQYSWAEVTNSILTHMSAEHGKQLETDRQKLSVL